jgi:ribosomal-protein-serine acetyltransferase
MFIHKIDEDLSLKLIELRDGERVFELTNNSRGYLREWLPWLDTTIQLEDTIEFIKICLKGFAENKSLNTVILFRGKIVGVAGYNSIDWSNKTAYIGYWLGEEFQGNGIMTKVANALTDYAISELNLNKIEIRAAVGNKKSRSIPERLNFVNEGCIRQAEWLYDHYVDHIVYGILAEEWMEQKIAKPLFN